VVLANQEKANIVIGAVFAELLKNWPKAAFLLPQKILSPLIETPTSDDVEMFRGLVKWLSDEGYLRYKSDNMAGAFALVVLSEKGLRTLNSVPSGITGTESFGDKIVEASKEVSKESAKKVIADLVGQMIGGVIKSLSGG
jgi:hypothetical protein